MTSRLFQVLTVALFAFIPSASPSSESEIQPLFDLGAMSTTPFPSDRFTVPDDSHLTGRRVHLPQPDCDLRPSDCNDIDTINTLDGFNLQPRLSIPFSGPIDPATVTSDTVFLLSLGDTVDGTIADVRIGINQVVWDVETNTLHVESDELLSQHTRYALIVTRGVRDASGNPVGVSDAFARFRHDLNLGQTKDPGLKAYRKALLDALDRAEEAGVPGDHIAVASVFTTLSVTAILEKIRAQIRAAAPPSPADFRLGDGPTGPRSVQTVFPLSAIQTMTVRDQVRVSPPGDFALFSPRLALLRLIPNAVGTVAFGSYRSPVYLNDERFMQPVGTRTGVPVVLDEDEIFFNLFLPSATTTRPRPEHGWPVAIYVGGCCAANGDKNGTSFNVAATLADRGVATISINSAGQGRGRAGIFTVAASGATVSFPAGGRSLDVDGDGTIGPGEGTDATGARWILLQGDGRRQTVGDLMQLVRVIEVGVDVDADGHADLDPSRIYYAGFSFGAITGSAFVAVEPNVRAAVLAAPGAAGLGRLAPISRFAGVLAGRVPSLLNAPGITNLDGLPIPSPFFNENMPLRNSIALSVRLEDGTSQTIQSPVVNTVSGASEIQQLYERLEWANMPANAAAYAPYLQKTPLQGADSRPLIVQFAKGDQNVPNPFTTAILRAGDLADGRAHSVAMRVTYYRTDRAVARYGAGPDQPPPTPPPGVETNGHNFQVRMNSPIRTAIARAAQEQMAEFFASDGTTVIDPNPVLLSLLGLIPAPAPLESLFEVLFRDALPENLNFIR